MPALITGVIQEYLKEHHPTYGADDDCEDGDWGDEFLVFIYSLVDDFEPCLMSLSIRQFDIQDDTLPESRTRNFTLQTMLATISEVITEYECERKSNPNYGK